MSEQPAPVHLRIHGNHDGRPGPLDCSFDDLIRALESLPRMFVEWDGSFVWRLADASALSAKDIAPAQWDGEVIDQGPAVQCLELRGRDPAANATSAATAATNTTGDSNPTLTPSLAAGLAELLRCAGAAPATVLVEQIECGETMLTGSDFLRDFLKRKE